MTKFTLDTSGEVLSGFCHATDPNIEYAYQWSDLDSFTQGYVWALLRDLQEWLDREGMADFDGPRGSIDFSWIAPETLAAILRDCAAAQAVLGYANTLEAGATFWIHRAIGVIYGDFRPLTVSLSDDDKVRFL